MLEGDQEIGRRRSLILANSDVIRDDRGWSGFFRDRRRQPGKPGSSFCMGGGTCTRFRSRCRSGAAVTRRKLGCALGFGGRLGAAVATTRRLDLFVGNSLA